MSTLRVSISPLNENLCTYPFGEVHDLSLEISCFRRFKLSLLLLLFATLTTIILYLRNIMVVMSEANNNSTCDNERRWTFRASAYLRLIYERRLIMFDSCIEFGLTIIIFVAAVSIVVSINW